MALLRNNKNEFLYQFNWIDCTGMTVGFNSVWAPNKREAKKLAKAMENQAHWAWYNGTTYVTVPAEVTTGGHCFYNKGMYLNVDSMYKATREQSAAMDLLAFQMTH